MVNAIIVMDLAEALQKKIRKKTAIKKVALESYENSEFSGARELWRSLLDYEDNPDCKLEILVHVATCDVMLQSRISQQSDTMVMQLLHESGKHPRDLRDMGMQLKGPASVILNVYESRLWKMQGNRGSVLKEIELCMLRVTNKLKRMIADTKSRKAAYRMAPLMRCILSNLEAVNCDDIDLRVLIHASALNHLGHVYNELNKVDEGQEVLLEGLELMKNRFGERASEYRTLSTLENNVAYAYSQRGEYDVAEFYQEAAVADMYKAKDFPEPARDQFSPQMEKSLRNVKEMRQRSGLPPKSREGIRKKSEVESDKKRRTRGSLQMDEIKDFGKRCFERGDYKEAREIFHDISEQKDNAVPLDVLIELAACDLTIDGEIQFETDFKITSTLEQPEYSWRNLEELSGKGTGYTANILQLYKFKLLTRDNHGDANFKELYECIERSHSAIQAVNATHGSEMTTKHIWIMHEISKSAQQLKSSNRENYIWIKAICMAKIGSLHNELSMYKDALKYLQQCHELLKLNFGESASKRSIFSTVSKEIGNALSKQKKFAEAAEFYRQALDEVKSAEDVSDEYIRNNIADGEERLQQMLEKTSSSSESHPAEQAHARNPTTERSTVLGSSAGHTAAFRATREVMPKISDVRDKTTMHTAMPGKDVPLGVGGGISYYESRKVKGHEIFEGRLRAEKVAVKKIRFSEKRKGDIERSKGLSKHPNVVECKASSEWPSPNASKVEFIYLAMELCCGDSLCDIVRQGQCKGPKRLQILKQLMDAICHIHASGFYHGDLRPRKLICSHDCKTIKVTYNGTSEESSISEKFGETLPEAHKWRSPDEETSSHSDIFTAGLITYYVLSNGTQPSFPHGVAPEQDLDCDETAIAADLISRMTDVEPTKRPSAHECRNSPLFWSANRKLCFLSNFSDRLSVDECEGQETHDIDQECLAIFAIGPGSKETQLSSATDHHESSDGVICDLPASCTFGDDFKLSALLRHIKEKYESLKSDVKQSQADAEESSEEMWALFHRRFPKLLSFIFKAAMRTPTWSAACTCEFLCLVQEYSSELHFDSCDRLLEHGWLDGLILSDKETSDLQAQAISHGIRYRINKHSIYNKAVVSGDDTVYDKTSILSLLLFLKNRSKSYAKDGKECRIVFGEGGAGVWQFFSVHFPQLFAVVHCFVCTFPVYSKILADMSSKN